MKSITRAIAIGSILISFCGCQTIRYATRVEGKATADLLPWLDEATTREQVLLELGTPAFSFEDGRILCYLLRRDSGSERLVAVPRIVGNLDPGHGSWKTAEYDLVVVFESDGTVGDLALAHFGEHVESLLW